MYTGCYDGQIISRYLDGQLTPDLAEAVGGHLKVCQACAGIASSYAAVSQRSGQALKAAAESDAPGVAAAVLKAAARMADNDNAQGRRVFRLPRRLAMAACVCLVFAAALVTYPGDVGNVAGPSAIVSEITGNAASVMIVQTPESGHTIIWYTES